MYLLYIYKFWQIVFGKASHAEAGGIFYGSLLFIKGGTIALPREVP